MSLARAQCALHVGTLVTGILVTEKNWIHMKSLMEGHIWLTLALTLAICVVLVELHLVWYGLALQ